MDEYKIGLITRLARFLHADAQEDNKQERTYSVKLMHF